MSWGSVWGRIAPPPVEECVGGGLFWAFKDNDCDSNRGFKAGSMGIMPTGWRDDESAAVQTAVLACRIDNESVAGRTTVLARWRDDGLAAGHTTVLAR